LEENGFHRSVSTTGNNPKDPRKNKPREKAVKYEITPDEIEQLVEVLIAQINNTPKKSLNNLTPLEVMEQRINRKMPFRTLDEEYRDGIEFTTIQETRVVRGNMNAGRRPYIHFEGVDYRSDILSENYTLVNTKLTLKINVEDLRVVIAYLPDGSELGFLKAQGKWGIRKHTLKVRKTINKLASRGDIYYREGQDPIEVYHNFLKEKAKKNRQARNQIAKHQKEMEQKYKEDAKMYNNQSDIEPTEKPNTENVESLFKKRNLRHKNAKLGRFSFNS
jgi:putative transposase